MSARSTFELGEQPESWRDVNRWAEKYRDDVLLPRGGCGFIWAHPTAPKHGNYACELASGHGGAHRNGGASWPWKKAHLRKSDRRLDHLMAVLVTLHELGIITDPAVSAEKQSEGTYVTVEFFLDFKREPAVSEFEATQRKKTR